MSLGNCWLTYQNIVLVSWELQKVHAKAGHIAGDAYIGMWNFFEQALL